LAEQQIRVLNSKPIKKALGGIQNLLDLFRSFTLDLLFGFQAKKKKV